MALEAIFILRKDIEVGGWSRKTNERICFYYYDEFDRSFIFWKNSRTPKSPFEII